MINTISPYRSLLASILALWMSLIVISGIVFMHKEVTSNGEIITHIHPYDFTKKKNSSHHHSDEEIRFLNVLFQANFAENSFQNYIEPFFFEFIIQESDVLIQNYHSVTYTHYNLRGPPAIS